MRFSAILDFRLETTDMAVCELSRRRNSQLIARAAVRARMQPDVSVGFGTEVEESGRWFDYTPWVLAFVLVAVYIVSQRKLKAGKKR